MLQGYRTDIGIVITILGMTGVAKIVTTEQMSQLADLIIQIIGIMVTIYGSYKAHQKIKEIE